jgi:hypothetical protein
MNKLLLTSGCSFSRPGTTEAEATWANCLEKKLVNYDAVHIGLASQGNDLISRKTIYTLTQLLKKMNPQDILVGIMWSGTPRHAVYLSNTVDNFPKVFQNQVNPTSVVPNNDKWYVLIPKNHPNMKDREFDIYSRSYYEYLYDQTGSEVETCEHILRTQWFLEKNNIKYFMSTYMSTVLPSSLKTNIEVAHLYNEINFDTFLPVDGEYEWCLNKSGLSFPIPGDRHPSNFQHDKFTDDIIIPFLKEKQYI